MAIWQEISKNRNVSGIFILLMLMYAASYFQRTALPGTIYNTLVSEFGLTAAQMGSLGAAFVYPYAICQLLSGSLIDRFCGTRVVLVGGVIFLAGAVLFPLSSNLPMLYFSRVLTGIGASTMFLSLVRETDRFFGRKNYAVYFGFAYFGGYAGGLMGSLPFELLCRVYPWRQVMLAGAGIAIIVYLAIASGSRRIELPPIPKTSISLKPFGVILRNPLSWLVIICGNIVFCTYFVIQTIFGKKFLEDFAGFSSSGASAVIFALTLVCMFTMLATSILTRLTGNRRRPWVIAACTLCMFASILMVCAICLHFPGWAFALIYCMFAAAAGIPPIFSMVMQEFNSRGVIAQSTATANMFGYLSVAISSQLIGILLDCFDHTGRNGSIIYSPRAYLTLFIIVSVLTVISFCCAIRMPETRGHYLHRDPETP